MMAERSPLPPGTDAVDYALSMVDLDAPDDELEAQLVGYFEQDTLARCWVQLRLKRAQVSSHSYATRRALCWVLVAMALPMDEVREGLQHRLGVHGDLYDLVEHVARELEDMFPLGQL